MVYGLQSRISNKIYSQSLVHALSPYDPIESFYNFIQIILGILCLKMVQDRPWERIEKSYSYENNLFPLLDEMKGKYPEEK